jgi:hypothetical protein
MAQLFVFFEMREGLQLKVAAPPAVAQGIHELHQR